MRMRITATSMMIVTLQAMMMMEAGAMIPTAVTVMKKTHTIAVMTRIAPTANSYCEAVSATDHLAELITPYIARVVKPLE